MDLTPDNLHEHLDELAEQMLMPERLERLRTVAEQRIPCMSVAFEDLYDPHNVNAGIRSCEVFGCPDVHVITMEHTFEMVHGVAKNAGRWVDVHRYESTRACIDGLHRDGFTVVGTLPEGEAVPFMDLPLPEKLCLVMGKEQDGLTSEAIELCDAHVTIPQYGFTQSLNISVACAILLQYFGQAYRGSGRDVHLREEELDALLRRWIERDLRKKLGWV